MPSLGGEITRVRILEAAESLFAEKGFAGTSVDSIAKAVGINKATIYYHFVNKREIITALFEAIAADIDSHVRAGSVERRGGEADEGAQLKLELDYLASKRRILSVLLVESLMSGSTHELLFDCAERVMEIEGDETPSVGKPDKARTERLVFEFFTGFLPIVAFTAFRDKWCERYGGDPDSLTDYFIAAFERTHLHAR